MYPTFSEFYLDSSSITKWKIHEKSLIFLSLTHFLSSNANVFTRDNYTNTKLLFFIDFIKQVK